MSETIQNFKELEDNINHSATVLADEITERHFLNKDDVFSYIKTWLEIAIKEATSIQVDDLQKQREGLKDQLVYINDMPIWTRRNLNQQLSDVNLKIKAKNKLLHKLKEKDQYYQLKKYIETRLGSDFLLGFFNYYNSDEDRK